MVAGLVDQREGLVDQVPFLHRAQTSEEGLGALPSGEAEVVALADVARRGHGEACVLGCCLDLRARHRPESVRAELHGADDLAAGHAGRKLGVDPGHRHGLVEVEVGLDDGAGALGVLHGAEEGGDAGLVGRDGVGGEAAGEDDDEAAVGREQLAEGLQQWQPLVRRDGGEDVQGEDAVVPSRRVLQDVQPAWEDGVGGVGVDEVDALGSVAGRVDGEAGLGERPRDVDLDEAEDGVHADARTGANGALGLGEEVTAARTDVEHALAGLQSRELERGLVIRMLVVARPVCVAHHRAKGSLEVGGSAVVDHAAW